MKASEFRPAVDRRAWARESARIVVLATIVGFVAWAGALWLYDATGGLGPLAPIGSWPGVRAAYLACAFLIQPVAFFVLIWRWNVRGALLGFLGLVLIGPAVFNLLPASRVAATERLGYGDETRGWIGFELVAFGVIWGVVMPIIVLIARSIWRTVRRRS